MPVYEDDTIHGAFRKAIGGARYAQKQEGSSCEVLRAQFNAKRLELQRRVRSYRPSSDRFDEMVRTYNEQSELHLTDQQRTDLATIVDAFTFVPGTIHSLMRITDPGELTPSLEQNWFTQTKEILEDAVFPDRRARHTADQYLQTIGALNEVGPMLLRENEELKTLSSELAELASQLYQCVSPPDYYRQLSEGERSILPNFNR